MQDTEVVSPKSEMSPYLVSSKYGSPCSSRSQSPCLPENHQTDLTVHEDSTNKFLSDDEISVGCPSPALTSPQRMTASPTTYRHHHHHHEDHSDGEDYFKPLKRLKMVNIDVERRISPTVEVEDRGAVGVKSFSIMDILNHRPSSKSQGGATKIVRPWDLDPEIEAQQSFERFHRHLKAQQLALLRPEFANFANASYASETGSDRSSSVASDCCSPDILQNSAHQRQRQNQQQKQQPGGTPLDALFQMTSKTFDSSTGEASSDGQSHLNLFNSRQQPKKKRKSRTAFTNHQIFELEKRFLYQKYLSPADRDEIASSLGLTNAQVITWFQNRRAKLKRDMEELKKDVESTKMLTAHKSFLENVQDLGLLKKKALVSDDDCPKNLVISPEK
ncbi:uncharacterized protein [Onthophagus taurus]|uniref:uncharacterized protein n=1 Tax=Onthophagus taurus TaxID=166361 RepID=UPI0039BE6009